jgi:hypothetical protein
MQMADEKGFMELESAELLDRFTDDPKAVLGGLKDEIRADLRTELQREVAENRVASTYQKFQEQYPDFEEKWKSGEIKAHIKKHPGHNALSAYLDLTRECRLRDGVKRELAKRSQSGDDERLKDSRSFGGRNTVLSKRLAERRMGSTGPGTPSSSAGLLPTI